MSKCWVLEGYFGNDSESLLRMPLNMFPARVGRDPLLFLPILQADVSRMHAEFFQRGDQLLLRDLGSRNGTLVNLAPLQGEILLQHGDVLHFASHEMRLMEVAQSEQDELNSTRFVAQPQSSKLPMGVSQFQRMLDARQVSCVFQPIVTLSGQLYAYEILGRGCRADFPASPDELFHIAESLPGKDVELSLLMRNAGVAEGHAQLQGRVCKLFMNTHPAELRRPKQLIDSLAGLREAFPHQQLVLEIHEDAVTDIASLKRLSQELCAMDIELAYDDFGAGQTRLLELIEVPVKYVKFDMSLVQGIHLASSARQKMIGSLVAMTRAMGIATLAEGVELFEEVELCREIGFDLAQGYHFSKPLKTLNYPHS
jgi:EAL domain-containing protein (putative c-di-GMP-specific phosphodiesterase class I)